ncbi:hypothetical protein GOBAR_DD16742 [Gossypium barbadense]|nr:hypothetical protein GOBAR_DD16742 [Gossypium barbadense]
MDQRLLKAARSGDINIIKQLSDAEGGILGGTTPQGNTALHMAARFGHENLVQEIMKRQPSLVLKSNLKGETPVHVATRGGHWRIVLLFRDSSSNGVYIARRLADKDRESLLLVNHTGESPLSIAIDLKLAVTAEAIIGLNWSTFEYRGPNGQTPLHCAVIRRDLHIMRKIHIRKPKIIKMQDEKQRTPLLKAGLQCNMEPEACYCRDQQLSSSAHFAWRARMVFGPNEATDIAVLF